MKKTKRQKDHDFKHLMAAYYNTYLTDRFARNYHRKLRSKKRNNLKTLRSTISSIKSDYLASMSVAVHSKGILYDVKQNRVKHIDWRFF